LNLRSKRRLAAAVLGVGADRIIFDPEAQDLIQDAITRSTIRGLVGMGAIKVAPIKGVSRGRARTKKEGGKARGHGSFKGTMHSRKGKKEAWELRVRALRWRLSVARDRGEVNKELYKKLYGQVKGGQVRGVKHLYELIKEARK
jgi:large subunit ribosomal protein L19e